ncbi:MAG: helix-turn-helix transcriptional regulator [Polyangiales bacterium]
MGLEHGVSKVAVDLLLAECRLSGLPADEVALLLRVRSDGFCSWQDYLAACEAVAELAGGVSALADVAEATVVEAMPHLDALCAAFEDVPAYAAFVAQAMDASAFVGVRYAMRAVDERRSLLKLTPAPGWKLTPALIAVIAGGFRAVSAPFGLGSAKVEIVGEGLLGLTMPQTVEPRGSRMLARALAAMLAQQREALEERVRLLEALRAARVEAPSATRTAEARAAQARTKWKLTARETDVVALVCTGLTNKEIAAVLSRGESTVELHVTSIMKKAAVSNRATLVARYYLLESEPWGFP